MTGLFSCSRSLYDSDHKFRKDITLDELRSVEVSHGPLMGVEYSHGGGMQGDTYYLELYRGPDESPAIRTTRAAEHSFSLIVEEYRADPQAFDALREKIDSDNLSVWSDLPFEDEFIALDAPSTAIKLIFDDTEYGGGARSSSWISYENVIPEGGRPILNDFAAQLKSYIHKEDLLDAYFVDKGERIMTGRDTDNTEEEISALLSGSWFYSGDGEERRIYSYGLRETVEESVIAGDTRRDDVFTAAEPVHEPYEDADTGWYVPLQAEDGTDWVMYTEGVELVIRRADGSAVRRYERQG